MRFAGLPVNIEYDFSLLERLRAKHWGGKELEINSVHNDLLYTSGPEEVDLIMQFVDFYQQSHAVNSFLRAVIQFTR